MTSSSPNSAAAPETPATTVLFAAKALFLALAFSIPISQALTYLCVVGLLLCTALLLVQRRPRLRQVDPFVWLTLALLGWITLATLWSSGSRTEIINEWSRYLPLLIVPIFFLVDSRCRAGATPRPSVRGEWLPYIGKTPLATLVMHGFMTAMALTVVLTFIKYGFWTDEALRLDALGVSVFKHYILQGVLSSLFAAMCLVLGFTAKNSMVRYALQSMAALAAISVVLMLPGRTGLLTMGLTLLMTPLLAPRERRALVAFAMLLLGFAVATVLQGEALERLQQTAFLMQKYLSAGSLPAETVEGHQGTAASTWIRLQFLNSGLDMVTQHPWVGFGTGSFQAEFCALEGSAWCDLAVRSSGQPHNQFLLLMIEQGAPGVIIFVLWFSHPIIRRIRGRAQRPPESDAKTRAAWNYLVAAVVSIATTHALLDSILHLPTEGMLYPLLLAALTSIEKIPTALHLGRAE